MLKTKIKKKNQVNFTYIQEAYNCGTTKVEDLKFEIFLYFNKTGATSGAGTAYPSGAPEFTPGF
jgi:hypothetical protein